MYHPSRSGPILRRRLTDALKDRDFAQVQLLVLQESSSAHHPAALGLKIAGLHRRLDAVDEQLRYHAEQRGEDAGQPMSELCRRLASRVDRRQTEVIDSGPERRLWVRREADRLVELTSASTDGPPFRESVRRLLDGLHVPVFIGDRYWQRMSANRAGAELLGYSVQELETKSIYDLAPSSTYRKLPTVGLTEWRHMTFRRKDGRFASLHTKARVVRLSSGTTQLLVGNG
jgi:PAS domain-containing protein